MNASTCCVVPNELRVKKNIRHALMNFDSKNQCQFYPALNPEYDYEGQKFCILHLPGKSFDLKKSNAFEKMITEGRRNFDFTSLPKVKINFSDESHLSFVGAYIWSLNIEQSTFEDLNLSCAKIRGINRILNTTINRVYITESDVRSYLEFKGCRITNFIINNTKFYYKEILRLDDSNYGIHFPDSDIALFRMINSVCELEMNFDNSRIKCFDIYGTKFYLCPSFFNFELKNQEVTLPNIKDYDFNKLKKQYRFYNLKNIKSLLSFNMQSGYKKYLLLRKDLQSKINILNFVKSITLQNQEVCTRSKMIIIT